jgi:hypothetical protein
MREFANSEMAEAVVSQLPDLWEGPRVLWGRFYGRISHFIS